VTVCLAWGGSYFAIRVALGAFPPLFLGALRYALAGSLLWAWCNAKNEEPLTKGDWLLSLFFGFCFVVVGNGTVLWAEQTVPSGMTALLVAVTPIGTLLFEWAFKLRSKPSGLTWLGLLLGLAGVVLLVDRSGPHKFTMVPVLVVLLGTLGWSLGSALSVKLRRPISPLRAIASQMIAGSLVLFILSGIAGEDRGLNITPFPIAPVGGLVYLILVASIAAYVAYGYLMTHVSPTAAGACTYINPIVAMLLGVGLGERIGSRELASLGIILVGVAVISSQELKRSSKRERVPMSKAPRQPQADWS
jgi:drug/metabolite transporter (DMT)-like permease